MADLNHFYNIFVFLHYLHDCGHIMSTLIIPLTINNTLRVVFNTPLKSHTSLFWFKGVKNRKGGVKILGPKLSSKIVLWDRILCD